ncbi:bacteriocin immunity protein [Spartinivicinus poritis]|uniref:Bacteriocin immunity protein n=1 Tax=Spartinivicinus poritis TaxID=2994640 RepID=A0ABT5UCN6_9GAMM|nr:bacteriocin immunity protein [Spartinivicinus sp. A2-2]MDE1464141.1 bacteriocin immunity protein [Spartinivicinus sp. A2-2]
MIQKSKSELIDLVGKIMRCAGTEKEVDDWVRELENSVPHPEVTGLIFYPKKADATAEEVVEEALAYKPIILGRD